MKTLALSITFTLALGISANAATFANTFTTNDDTTAKSLEASRIGSQVSGSNYLNAAQVGSQVAGSNYTTSAQIGGSNFLNAVQVGAQIGGSNYTTSAQIAGSNFLNAAQVGSQIAGSNYLNAASVGSQIAGSNYIGTNVPYTHIANIDQGTNGSEYHLRDDSSRMAALPVAVFIAQATNSAMILDLMPNGDNTITNAQTPFFTAIDLVNRNLTAAPDNTNFYVARLALKTNEAVIGSSAGGTNDAPRVTFQAGTNNARPFAWVYQGTGGASTTTNMWTDSSGVLWNLNGIHGATNGVNAVVGIVGETTNVLNVFATGTNLVNNLNTNILKITLTPGDWDVRGHFTYASSVNASVSQAQASISTTINTIAVDGSQVYSTPNVTNNAFTDSVTIDSQQINSPTNVTVYMNAKVAFTAGTLVGYGQLHARRVR